jgi:hypothetical protein
MICQDAHACEQICKQFCKAPRLIYKLTNYKPKYPNDCDNGFILDSDVVKDSILSKSDIYGFKSSTVSTFFDLWFLGDKVSRIYPYKLTDAYYIHYFEAYHVPLN